MGFAPFTIFFMACLISFFGNSAAAHGCSISVEWHEKCANKAYCHKKPTKGYPTTSEFKTMRDNSNFVFPKVETPPLINRDGERDPCRQTHEQGFIYMIKDTKNRTRIVVTDPELFQFHLEFKECKPQVQLPPQLTCQQIYTTVQLPVTTCDGTGLELFNVSIPSGCGARTISLSDYDD